MSFARTLALGLSGLVLAHAGEASASGINVNPVQIQLSEKASSALLTISNHGEGILRVQLSTSAWDQDPSGEMVLVPTKDVIFFPTFLTLEPGKEGKVRIGIAAKAGATEKTFRIFVEELPPLETEMQPGVVAVRTRMGIPIFLAPSEAKVRSDVSVSLARGKLKAEIVNAGNVHFVPGGIHVRGLGKRGEVAWERGFDGWYVLSGGKRIYEADVPPDVCGKISTLVMEAKVGDDLVTRRIETGPQSCTR